MTKDVLVKITGVHEMEEDSDDLSVITAGSYYFKNGRHYIIYDEVLEGESGTIRNTIKAGNDEIDIIKGGDARAHMIFQPQRANVSCYVTPYGQMMVGVMTDRLVLEEEEDYLRIILDYTLEVNYEKTSQCHIEVEVSSKASAKLNL